MTLIDTEKSTNKISSKEDLSKVVLSELERIENFQKMKNDVHSSILMQNKSIKSELKDKIIDYSSESSILSNSSDKISKYEILNKNESLIGDNHEIEIDNLKSYESKNKFNQKNFNEFKMKNESLSNNSNVNEYISKLFINSVNKEKKKTKVSEEHKVLKKLDKIIDLFK